MAHVKRPIVVHQERRQASCPTADSRNALINERSEPRFWEV